MDANEYYSEHFIDGCKVICVIVDSLPFTIARVQVFNKSHKSTYVDFRKLRIKFQGWYYYVPWTCYVAPGNNRCFEMDGSVSLVKVDNLTYIEEEAIRKNLI